MEKIMVLAVDAWQRAYYTSTPVLSSKNFVLVHAECKEDEIDYEGLNRKELSLVKRALGLPGVESIYLEPHCLEVTLDELSEISFNVWCLDDTYDDTHREIIEALREAIGEQVEVVEVASDKAIRNFLRTTQEK